MSNIDANDPARAGFDALLEALAHSGELVRDADRGVEDAAERAGGYTYATELLRTALDLYADADGDSPRFVPFSTPTPYHAGELAVQRVQGGANPDGLYDFAALRSDRAYRIHGRRGNDCYFSLSFSGGRPGARPDRTAATLNDREMTFAPDGSFEVIVSAEPRDGNWVRMEDDICSVIVRQYFLEPPPARTPAVLAIELLDAPNDARNDRAQSTSERLGAAAAFIRSTCETFPFPSGGLHNSFSPPLGYTGEAGALGTTDNVYCMGRWQLAPGEQLVVETAPVPCGYWSLQLWNHWGQSLTSTIDGGNYPRQIINSANAERNADGTVRIVVSDTAPVATNWLDTFGWTHGTLIFRYLYPEALPDRPETHVLPPS